VDHTAPRPLSVTLTFVMMRLSAFVWLALAAVIFLKIHPALPDSETVRLIMAGLAFLAGSVLLALSFLVRGRTPFAYYAALLALAAASIVVLLDDLGWVDLAYLAISGLPIILLLKDRSWYLHPLPR
jgi:hypothetical protein